MDLCLITLEDECNQCGVCCMHRPQLCDDCGNCLDELMCRLTPSQICDDCADCVEDIPLQ